MKSYGYDSYRGRSRLRSALKVIIVLLLVVLAVLLAAFLFLQRYMVISADGIRFEPPFFQDEDAPPSSGGPSATPLPVVTTPSPSPSASPVPSQEYLHAVALPREALYDGTAAQLVEQSGGNAALFDMKADDGSLGYVSDLKLAMDIRASASSPDLNDAIRTLNEGELYTIARVSCFRDNALPYYQNGMALRSNSGNYKDDERIRWANPGSESVRDYLAGVCVELAQLGFDEILLDNAGYPTRGDLSKIRVGEDNYDPDTLEQEVEACYQAIREALEEYDVKLSIVSTAQAVSQGSDPLSGQSIALLTRYADRVWLSGDGETDYAALLEAAGLEESGVNCVQMGPNQGDIQGSWAMIPTT